MRVNRPLFAVKGGRRRDHIVSHDRGCETSERRRGADLEGRDLRRAFESRARRLPRNFASHRYQRSGVNATHAGGGKTETTCFQHNAASDGAANPPPVETGERQTKQASHRSDGTAPPGHGPQSTTHMTLTSNFQHPPQRWREPKLPVTVFEDARAQQARPNLEARLDRIWTRCPNRGPAEFRFGPAPRFDRW